MVGAKRKVEKLITILTSDLGIKKQDITIYYSGNEGFHIHVSSPEYEKLDSRHRADLVDYVTFKGAIPETFGARTNFAKSIFSDVDDKGWPGRVSKKIFGSKSNKPKISKEIISEGYPAFKKRLESSKKRSEPL